MGSQLKPNHEFDVFLQSAGTVYPREDDGLRQTNQNQGPTAGIVAHQVGPVDASLNDVNIQWTWGSVMDIMKET